MKDIPNYVILGGVLLLYLQIMILSAVLGTKRKLNERMHYLEESVKSAQIRVIFDDRDPIEISSQEKATQVVRKAMEKVR